MTDAEKADFTSKILSKLVKDNKTKLAHGLKLRQEIHDQIEKGCQPAGYRVDWIKASSIKVVNLLHDIGIEFNSIHTDDRVSVQDLLDVLATTLHLLKTRAGLKEEGEA